MSPLLATAIFGIAMVVLFRLNRNPAEKTSWALWIPIVWVVFAGSRPASVWLSEFGLGGFTTVAPIDYVDGSPFDRNVFTCMIFVAIIVLFQRRQRLGALLRINGAVLIFFLYCAISILWSDYQDIAFKRLIKAVGEFAIVLLVLTERDTLAAFKQFLARAGFLLLPTSVLLIKYYPELGRAFSAGDTVSAPWTPMYTGVCTTKNYLGLITMLFGLGAVWRLLGLGQIKDKRLRRNTLISQGALVAMVIWLLIMAQSATSLSCFAFGSALMTLTLVPRLGQNRLVLHLAVLGVLFIAAFALFFDSGGALVGKLGRNAGLTGRTDIWDLVLSLAGSPLVGTGFESFWLGDRLQKIWALIWWHPNEAHNGYLEVYLNLGWIGLVFLAVLFIAGYRNVMAELRSSPQTGRLKLAYITITVVYNLTESGVRTLHPIWIFILLAVIALPKARVPDNIPVLAPTELVPHAFEFVPQADQFFRAQPCKEPVFAPCLL